MQIDGREGQRVQAALLMIACDIPAARKVSGFTDIGSICACFKCNRQFENVPGNNLKRDFSSFSKEEIAAWQKRTGSDNRRHANSWIQATTLEQRAAIERQYGARWYELHRLSYFDAVWCTVIDPMHNLYSGTAKRAFNLWKQLVDPSTNRRLLSVQDFEEMADQMANTILPSGYDIPPGKIASAGVNLTSDEWRMWVLAVTPRVLQEKLIGAHMWTWFRSVEASYSLVKAIELLGRTRSIA